MSLDKLKKMIKEGSFHNPTKGVMNLEEVIKELIAYKKENKEAKYKVVLGTDSEQRERGTDFVCVVAIHRIGHGGRFFWNRIYDQRKLGLRNRIHQEATISLALAGALLEIELELNRVKIDIGRSMAEIFKSLEGASQSKEIVFSNELEIHVDIGSKGPTKEMIKEIVGMIKGNGFFVKIKPEAFAAANLADKFL